MKSLKFRIKISKWGIGWLVFCFFICGNCVWAETDKLTNDNVLDVYAVVVGKNNTEMFSLEMYRSNEKIFYSIDYLDESGEFSSEQIEYIRKIGYYGYGYVGHDDYMYYMAAQELIWEYIMMVDVYWVYEFDINGERVDIDNYKKEIIDLIQDSDVCVEFNFEDGQVFKVMDEVSLNDNNNVLDNYEVVSSNYSSALIKENELVIKVGNTIGDEVIVFRKKGYYDHDSLVSYYDNKWFVSNGNYNMDEEEVSFRIEGVSLMGIVVNNYNGANNALSEDTLQGAIYELYDQDDNFVGSYVSDENGRFVVDGLLIGNYYFRQVKASEGYLINDDLFEVVVDRNNVSVKLMQEIIRRTVILKVLYGNYNNYNPLTDAKFFLSSDTNDVKGFPTTNNQGEIKLKLFYGTYKITQRTGVDGYRKADDFVIKVSNDSPEIIYFNVINELEKVRLKINTLDRSSDDSVFGDGFSYKLIRVCDNSYVEYNGEDVFVSNNKGELVFPVLLDYGEYVLKQVDTSYGYLLNEESLEFSIDDSSNIDFVNNELVMEINFYNELVMGEVNSISFKEIYYSGVNEYGYDVVLSRDSEFLLVANKDIVVNGEVKYKAMDEVYKGIVNGDGKLIINDLYLGDYCLVNLESDESKCFSLKYIDNRTRIISVDLEYINYLEKGNIVIHNLSFDGNNIFNSLFEVSDSNGEVIYFGFTNEDGVIKLDNLLVGDYCIRQKAVSLEYEPNSDEMCVFLSEDMEALFINNSIINKVIEVPNTLSSNRGWYRIIIVLGVGICVWLYRKVFASKF